MQGSEFFRQTMRFEMHILTVRPDPCTDVATTSGQAIFRCDHGLVIQVLMSAASQSMLN